MSSVGRGSLPSRDRHSQAVDVFVRCPAPIAADFEARDKVDERDLRGVALEVEHALAGVKRARIVKVVLRHTKEGVSDAVMAGACGLHNLRVQNPKRRLKS